MIAAAVLAGAYGARTYQVLLNAERVMTTKGFMVLAAEDMQNYRWLLVRSERGCRALLQANFEGRFMDRADWAAQACLENGVEIPEAFIALAGVRETTNREEEALGILKAANQKFKDDPSISYRLAKLLAKGGRGQEAIQFLVQAAERVPKNIGIQMETLAFLIQQKDFASARPIVERLRGAPANDMNAAGRVLMAEVLLKQGDTGSAREQIKQAEAEWKSFPAPQREKLQKIAPEAVKLLEQAKK